ncbi:MAG: hypothetical protein VCC04_00375 [Myxococcota bacterium]
MSPTVSREEMLRSLPPDVVETVARLSKEARRRRFGLYVVGGLVRDLLLSRTLGDLDLLLVAPRAPRGVAAAVAARALGGEVKVVEYGRFGTIRLEMAEAKVDLALARREHYRSPGALPSVEPAELEEDLQRRDFSVNALALDLLSEARRSRLRVIDPMGGLDDLDRRQLRILHPRSFHDDPTRALRAARLAPRLDFNLARSSRSALRKALQDGALSAVSGDRLRREIDRIFSDSVRELDPVLALRRLSQWGVLPALEPGLSLPQSSIAPIRRLGRAVASPPWRSVRFRPSVSGLAIWLAEISPSLRQRMLQRLSLRGEAAARIGAFERLREQTLPALSRARGRGAVDARLSQIDEESLYALYAVAPTPIRRRIVRWAAEDRLQRLPITGADLVELGLEGPALGRVLGRIRTSFLDGELVNREECLTLAQELVRRGAGRTSGSGRASRPGGKP